VSVAAAFVAPTALSRGIKESAGSLSGISLVGKSRCSRVIPRGKTPDGQEGRRRKGKEIFFEYADAIACLRDALT